MNFCPNLVVNIFNVPAIMLVAATFVKQFWSTTDKSEKAKWLVESSRVIRLYEWSVNLLTHYWIIMIYLHQCFNPPHLIGLYSQLNFSAFGHLLRRVGWACLIECFVMIFNKNLNKMDHSNCGSKPDNKSNLFAHFNALNHLNILVNINRQIEFLNSQNIGRVDVWAANILTTRHLKRLANFLRRSSQAPHFYHFIVYFQETTTTSVYWTLGKFFAVFFLCLASICCVCSVIDKSTQASEIIIFLVTRYLLYNL